MAELDDLKICGTLAYLAFTPGIVGFCNGCDIPINDIVDGILKYGTTTICAAWGAELGFYWLDPEFESLERRIKTGVNLTVLATVPATAYSVLTYSLGYVAGLCLKT